MKSKYRALRIVGTLFKVLAWIVLLLGLLATAFAIFSVVSKGIGNLGAHTPLSPQYRNMMPNITIGTLVGAVIMGLGSFFYFLLLYAAGDLIYLLLAIEQSVRETAYYLKLNS